MKGTNNRNPPRVSSSCRVGNRGASCQSNPKPQSPENPRISSGGPHSPHTYLRTRTLRRVTDNLSDVTWKENTQAVNGSMGNEGINNRKSPCPLRAIKLQAIFFRRIPISPSHFPCLTSLHLTSPTSTTSTTSNSPPHPLFHLRHPLAVTTYLVSILPTLLFVLGIYVHFSLSLSLFLSLRLSPPFYILDALFPLVHFSVPLSLSLCRSFIRLLFLAFFFSFFLLFSFRSLPFPTALQFFVASRTFLS